MHCRHRVWLLQSVTVVRGGAVISERKPAPALPVKSTLNTALLLARVVPAF